MPLPTATTSRSFPDRISIPRRVGWLEFALWLVAGSCAVTLLAVAMESVRAQRAVDRLNTSPAVLTATEPGQVIGQMEIPALRLSVPITEGIGASSLLSGVGRVGGSAVPGGLGTLVLAGHRDTYLRPLERVTEDMDIVVRDRTGAHHYAVDRWEIVRPEQVESIAMRDRPELALVTCYPFHYVGPAPKRFVVHAHLVSLVPDSRR
jgi:sortase A